MKTLLFLLLIVSVACFGQKRSTLQDPNGHINPDGTFYGTCTGTGVNPAPSNLIGTIKYVNPDSCKINFILVYRNQYFGFRNSVNVTLTATNSKEEKPEYTIEVIGFETKKEMVEWLNTSYSFSTAGDHKHKKTRMLPEDILGIYDLRTAKKLTANFYSIKKSKPKQVIIEKEEWVEEEFKIN